MQTNCNACETAVWDMYELLTTFSRFETWSKPLPLPPSVLTSLLRTKLYILRSNLVHNLKWELITSWKFWKLPRKCEFHRFGRRTFTCSSLTSFAGFGAPTHMTMGCRRNFFYGEKTSVNVRRACSGEVFAHVLRQKMPFMLENVFNQETRANTKDI